MYQEEIETSRVFLRETTAVPDVAILLFGGALSVDHAASTVSVSTGLGGGGGVTGDVVAGAGKLKFRAAPETGVLFKLLRRELDRLLAAAAADPAAAAATLGASGGGGGGGGGPGEGGGGAGQRLRDVLLKLLPGGSSI